MFASPLRYFMIIISFIKPFKCKNNKHMGYGSQKWPWVQRNEI